jgi:hypothetical protein
MVPINAAVGRGAGALAAGGTATERCGAAALGKAVPGATADAASAFTAGFGAAGGVVPAGVAGIGAEPGRPDAAVWAGGVAAGAALRVPSQ